MSMDAVTLTRFEAKVHVEPNTGCWLWRGSENGSGYGEMRVCGAKKYAHRLSYEHFKGPILDGLTIDHLCRTPSCCNPDHLEAVTQRENNLRGTSPVATQARQTHCRNGHELTATNLVGWRKDRKRECAICRRAWKRAYAREERAHA